MQCLLNVAFQLSCDWLQTGLVVFVDFFVTASVEFFQADALFFLKLLLASWVQHCVLLFQVLLLIITKSGLLRSLCTRIDTPCSARKKEPCLRNTAAAFSAAEAELNLNLDFFVVFLELWKQSLVLLLLLVMPFSDVSVHFDFYYLSRKFRLFK